MSMYAELADGRRLEFPDGTDPAVIQRTVKKVIGAPPDRSAEIPAPLGEVDKNARANKDRIEPPQPNLMERIGGGLKGLGGLAETGLSMATGVAGAAAGGVAGAARTAMSGSDFGTPEGIRKGEETASKVRDAMTYQPRTEIGQQVTGDVSHLLGAFEGMPPHLAVTNPATAEAAAPRAAAAAKREPAPVMAGVGSAETDAARMARERAASLPVPLTGDRGLTKGIATRDFEQLRFERETAKDGKAGKPLRERMDALNDGVLKNIDAMLDETGAELPTSHQRGRATVGALEEKAASYKARWKAAYADAEKSGETAERVPTKALDDWLEKNKAAAGSADVIRTARQWLKQYSKDGSLTLAESEELRKVVGTVGGKDATNGKYAGDLKEIIDAATEGKGGEKYKAARAIRREFAVEYENRSVIDRLLSMKPGTADRSVAYEDVFDHSILKSDLDSLEHFKKTIFATGPKGDQAWKELQGQTIDWLKDSVTKGTAMNEKRQPIVSAAAFKKSIKTLDADGKLEVVFGKQRAQQIRDLGDVVQEIQTVPPGSVNPPNTAAILKEGLSDILLGRIPSAALKLGKGYKAFRQSKATERRVRDALEDPVFGTEDALR